MLQAVKQFKKEVGAPDAIIYDAIHEQKSQEMSKLLNEIGTNLIIIEEDAPWANKYDIHQFMQEILVAINANLIRLYKVPGKPS